MSQKHLAAALGLTIAACTPNSSELPEATNPSTVLDDACTQALQKERDDHNRVLIEAYEKSRKAETEKNLRERVRGELAIAIPKFFGLADQFRHTSLDESYMYCRDKTASIHYIEPVMEGDKRSYPEGVNLSACDQVSGRKTDCYIATTIADLSLRDPTKLFVTFDTWNDKLEETLTCIGTAKGQPDFKKFAEQYQKEKKRREQLWRDLPQLQNPY